METDKNNKYCYICKCDNTWLHLHFYISAINECFLSFKFNCGGVKEKLSKAGSDILKSMIDSRKVYNDVELQQILNTSRYPTVWVHRNCVSTYCS